MSGKIRCLVIDDEMLAREGIIEYINEIEDLTIVGQCSSAIEAADFLKKNEVDLMFLDIQMPYLLGTSFLESLSNPPLTIFTTAYSEYAVESYELKVVDYLLKPISFKRFFQAVTAARELLTSTKKGALPTQDNEMFIKQNDTFIKIVYTDILFVESMQNYIKLHFLDKTITVYQTMTSIENTLPASIFFRVHKSFLINLNHIDQISANKVFIKNHQIPISRNKKDELFNNVVNKKLISK